MACKRNTVLECMCDGDAGEKLPRDGAEGRQLGLLGQRPVLRSVIQRMLQPNPADRPSAAGLVQQACASLCYHLVAQLGHKSPTLLMTCKVVWCMIGHT